MTHPVDLQYQRRTTASGGLGVVLARQNGEFADRQGAVQVVTDVDGSVEHVVTLAGVITQSRDDLGIEGLGVGDETLVIMAGQPDHEIIGNQ